MDYSAYACPRCPGAEGDPGVLDVIYDYDAVAFDWRQTPLSETERRDVFRYLPVLPVDHVGALLQPGGTPLVSAPRLGASLGAEIWLKDETRNPTRCLKDRATAIAVTIATTLGHRELYCASPGNAAISLAAFCASQDLGCHVFVPRDLSPVRRAWLERFNADVRIGSGPYDDAYAEAEAIGRTAGWYSRNCALNPFLVEGKKTVAYEIFEAMPGAVPDMVVSPVGDGCTLAAIGKGFRELYSLGRIDRLPQLVGVQAESHAPLVHRREGALPVPSNAEGTRAVSIAVRRPRNAIRLLQELDHSKGIMIAVSDREIDNAYRRLAQKAGAVVEFSTAATLAGLTVLARLSSVKGKTIVLVLTGGRVES